MPRAAAYARVPSAGGADNDDDDGVDGSGGGGRAVPGTRSVWLSQLGALSSKSVLVARRGWGRSAAVALAPLAALLALAALRSGFEGGGGAAMETLELEVRRCTPLDGFGDHTPDGACSTLGYAPDEEPFRSVMARVGREAGLEPRAYASEREMLRGVFGTRDSHLLVSFSGEYGGPEERGSRLAPPSRYFGYRVFYNDTSAEAGGGGRGGGIEGTRKGLHAVLSLQRAVDGAVAAELAGEPDTAYRVRVRPFLPLERPTRAELDAWGSVDGSGALGGHSETVYYAGNTLLVMGFVMSCLVAMRYVMAEKNAKLLGALRVMGLRESAYWLSWYAAMLLLAALGALAAVTAGIALDLYVYRRATFAVMLLLHFLFFASMLALSCALSAVVSRPRWANTAGLVLLLVACGMAVNAAPDGHGADEAVSFNRSRLERAYTWLMPWTWFNKVWVDMVRHTADGSEYRLANLADDTGSASTPTAAHAMLQMALSSAVYLALAWYGSQAFASQLGASLPSYFCLLPRYWGFGGGGGGGGGAVEGDTVGRERVLSERNGTLRTLNLSKSYEGATALREVTLEMAPGEVFTLLGHNGAGKTTLIRCLTGLCNATAGSAFAFGLDVDADRAELLRQTGVCHQENLLWPELTAEDHLRLNAGMRALPRGAVEDVVRGKVAQFFLGEWASARVSQMSGGTQRRLCLAAATVGEPRLVFLDEPSTGLDPVNQHNVWSAIRGLRQRGGIVVLTTHSMEEAEALGDRVAMLSRGRLRAYGTPLFLKGRFGRGYQMQLTVDAADVPQLSDLVARHLPGADVTSSAAGTVSVGVPRPALRHMAAFFLALRESVPASAAGDRDGAVGIAREWTFSNSTLEEVFLRLCAQEEGVNQAPAGAGGAPLPAAAPLPPPVMMAPPCAVCRERPCERVTLTTPTGLLIDTVTVVCRRCGVGEEAAAEAEAKEEEAGEEKEAPAASETAMLPPPPPPPPPQAEDRLDVAALLAGVDDDSAGDDAGRRRDAPPPEEVDIFAAANDAGQSEEERFARAERIQNYVGDGVPSAFSQVRAIFLKNAAALLSARRGLLIRMLVVAWYAFVASINNTDNLRVPTLPVAGTAEQFEAEALAEAAQSSGALVPACFEATAGGNSTAACGLVAAAFGAGNVTWAGADDELAGLDAYGLGPGAQEATLGGADAGFAVGWHAAAGGSLDEAAREAQRRVLELDTPPAGGAAAALAREMPLAGLDAREADAARGRLDATLRYFPASSGAPFVYSHRSTGTGDATMRRYADTFLPRALAYLGNAVARSASGADASSRAPLLELLGWSRLPGLDPFGLDYFAAEIVAGDVVSRLLVGTMLNFPAIARRVAEEHESGLFHTMRVAGLRPVVYWLGNAVFDAALGSAWSAGVLAVFYLMSVPAVGHALVAWFFLLGVVWPAAQVSLGLFIGSSFRKPGSAAAASYSVLVSSWLLAAPLVALVDNGRWPWWLLAFPPMAVAHAGGQLARFGGTNTLFWRSVGAALGTSAALLGVVVARQALAARWPCAFRGTSARDAPAPDGGRGGEEEDCDVTAERRRVEDAQTPAVRAAAESGLLLRGLEKEFPGGKRAVAGVTLAVAPGEVLGLLGPNGAGKTTICNMLSGAFPPSAGAASVAGHDAAAEQREVFARLGVCGQSDTLWKELTVREHLLFYARLKGADSAHEHALAQHMAEEVGLAGDALHTKASELSGGMRRRLSVAASLVGNPRVWLLDEPTTGLSPESRHQMWDIVQRQRRRGRAVLLTTHSMQEAETLASRIAIMSHGRLAAVGSQQRLKRRFGSGYKLTFGLERRPGDAALRRLTAFVRRGLCAGAALESVSGASAVYVLPQDATESVIALFHRLEGGREEIREQLGIVEWSVRPSSLHEVFVARVRDVEPSLAVLGDAADGVAPVEVEMGVV